MIGGVLLCIGDSMTNGARSPRGFPHIAGDLLSQRFRQAWVGVNKGINGETSSGLINRIFDVMKEYPMAHEVIVTIGSNDAKDKVATSMEVYKANWRYIVNCAEFLGKKLYIGLVPDMHGFGAPDYSVRCNERIETYNEFLQEEYGEKYTIVDFTRLGKEMYCDGVHCNMKGYEEMAKRFLEAVKKEREITPRRRK